MSRGHFGTGAELSRPPANISATIGRTEERFNYYWLLLLKRTTGLHKNTPLVPAIIDLRHSVVTAEL